MLEDQQCKTETVVKSKYYLRLVQQPKTVRTETFALRSKHLENTALSLKSKPIL